MAQAVEVFKANGVEADRLAQSQQTEIAAKARRQLTVESRVSDFETAARQSVTHLSQASAQLQATARNMSGIAEETNMRASAVAGASDQATSNVQTVVASAEQLNASVDEIGRQLAASTRIAGQAVAEVERSNTQVRGLANAAQKIGDVVKLISDIAGQTNLLALNATMEAARAGDAGKGFAIVASEVKNRATQTARAMDDIAAQVADIQTATGAAVQAIAGNGRTINSVNEIPTAIASAIEQQGAATAEIARYVQQAASQTGSGAAQVLDAADALAHQATTLRGEVDRFLAAIRAA